MKLYYASLIVTEDATGFGVEEAERRLAANGTASCDALWVASISFRGGNGTSVYFYSYDGGEREMPDSEWLRVWAYMAGALLQMSELSDSIKHLCAIVWQFWNDQHDTPSEGVPEEHLTYTMSYKLDKYPEGLSTAEVQRRCVTAASDAFVLGIIKKPHPGIAFGATDGAVTPHVWWEVWAFLSKRLMESTTLTPAERTLPELIFSTIAAAMRDAN